VKFQTELCQPLPELIQEPDGLGSMLKTQHKVVSVANDDYIALRAIRCFVDGAHGLVFALHR
jgi:hypothetical protein